MSGEQLTVEEIGFLKYLSESGQIRLEPFVSPEGVIYKNLWTEHLDWKQVLFFLTTLTKKGFLNEVDYDRAIFCPTCDSPHVYSKYACPVDRSIFIKKITLLQHVSDGFQGEKEVFEREDRLICPQCGEDLGHAHDSGTRDETLREIGFSFECEKSGHKFERPLVLHFCPDCGSMFDYKTAHYVRLYAYSLTDKAKTFLQENLDVKMKLAPLIQLLESEGFETSHNVEISGVSGSNHMFDLTAERNGSTILFDYGFGDSNKLVSLLGKKMDLPGREAVLIDFSADSELGNLGKVYNIPILEVGQEGWKMVITDLIINLKKPQKKKVQRRRLWGRSSE